MIGGEVRRARPSAHGTLARAALAMVLGACAGRSRGLAAPYPEHPLPPSTRVLLVAGGDDVANFAAEVIAQRRMWRAAGLSSDAIACYWAKPQGRAWARDRAQYRRLAPALVECRQASPARLQADLAQLAAQRPAWLYLYVTAHGVPSLASPKSSSHLPPDERALLRSPALALDGATATRVQHVDAILAARRGGAPDDDLVFTPRSLRLALDRLPASSDKIVVLQGCFSGAFLTGDDGLNRLDNTVVLTAAAADRPSFGCGSGTRMTFWGGALMRELRRRVRPGVTPTSLPWQAIHHDVARRVGKLERALGQLPSRPQFAGPGP